MSFDLLRRFRTAATLAVLLVVLLVGVSWGWSAVTAPLPESDDTPVCETTQVPAGTKVYPDQVTVSVLNAGNEEGLAGRTMQQLVDRGFAQGEELNAPARADVRRAEVWTDDRKNASAQLVAAYLAKKGRGVVIRESPTVGIGVNVVVGDDFRAVVKGPKAVTARVDSSACSPPS